MNMTKTGVRETHRLRHADEVYLSESTLRVRALMETTLTDRSTLDSLFFSTGVVDRIERCFNYGCAIVGDSNMVISSLDRLLLSRFPVRAECFIDLPNVNATAEQLRVTRAEVAMEYTLSQPGPKLIVVGSAPMALNRLLQMHHSAPLREVVLIAAPTGFANVVEIKERVWESGLPCIVARGRKGGVALAATLCNALLQDAVNRSI